MEVFHSFDGGIEAPYSIENNKLIIDLSKGGSLFYIKVADAPSSLTIRLKLDEKGEQFLKDQGILISQNGDAYTVLPLEKKGEGEFEAQTDVEKSVLWIAGRYPYGRERLDSLVQDTAGSEQTSWAMLKKGGRSVPLFEFGDDDGKKPVHYIIAGEDVSETAGTWVGDYMIREICSDRKLAAAFKESSSLRIIPLVSPFSVSFPNASYTTPEGEGIYGAATWGDEDPPPEYAMLRDMVTNTIKEKRLGIMLTVHSWQGAHEHSEIGTIKSAGENRLSEEREKEVEKILNHLIQNVPEGKNNFSDKIWHPGLARDYLLAAFNAVTFRIEITTHSQGYEGFRKTAQALLGNIVTVEDLKFVLG